MMIKGITVTLYQKEQAGVDNFNAPIYTTTAVEVENVLVAPVDTAAVVDDLRLYGKRCAFELCIPKGDTHCWEDAEIKFFGQRFRSYGYTTEWIEDMVPLAWNRKVRVERYG